MLQNEEYIKHLINEAIEEALGKRGGFQFVDDEGDDEVYNGVDDTVPTESEPETSNKPGTRGSAFRGPKYMQNASTHNAALSRMRSNLPFDEKGFAAPWMDDSEAARNPHNKSNRDLLSGDIFGRIKVLAQPVAKPKSEEYSEPIILITMLNIDPEDCVEIARKFSRVGHTLKVGVARTRQNNTRDGVTFIVYNRSIKQWEEEDLEQILDFIGEFKNEDGTPKYFKDEEEKNNLRQYVMNRVVTGSDLGDYFSRAKENNIQLFNSFIEAESDEKIQEFIKRFQRFGLSNSLCSELGLNNAFGRILSVQNASLVLGSGKLTGAGVQPTFILTENIWRKMFNRVVNPNAVPFYIWVPSNRIDINKRKEQQFTSKPYVAKGTNGEDVEISKTEDVLNTFFFGKKWNELSQQQKISASVLCNFINPSLCYPMAEFDVSDTTLIPGEKDVFNEEIGLANNLSGELNKAAEDFVKMQNIVASEKKEEGGEDGEETIDAFSAAEEQLNEYALKNINEYCQAKNIAYKEVEGSVSLTIINALRTIAKPHISLKKEQNIAILVDDAVYAACLVMRICLDAVKTLKIGKAQNEIEYSQYVKAFSELMNVINGNWKDYEPNYNNMKAVSEGVDEGCVEEGQEFNPFKNKKYSPKEIAVLAAQALPNNKVASDMFESLLERMDKSKRNLL